MAGESGIEATTRVPAGQLRWRCDPAELPFKTTDEIEPLEDIIGQDRATAAIRLGLDVPSKGYNIFVAGFVGTGRNTTIQRFLEEARKGTPPPVDLAYVNNFSDPDRPRLLRFPSGRACAFRSAVRLFVEGLRGAIPKILDSEPFHRRRKQVMEDFAAREKTISRQFEEKLASEKFALVQVEMGPIVRPDIVPLVAGRPLSMDELEKLVGEGQHPKEDFEAKKAKYDELSDDLRDVMKSVRELSKERTTRLSALERDAVKPALHEPMAEIRAMFPGEAVEAYLAEIEKNVLENLDEFRGRPEPSGPAAIFQQVAEDPLRDYEVNVIVDNSSLERAPVVIENFPTYKNLFGAIERELERPGAPARSDFTRIKAGSLLRANGGHLVVGAMDVLMEPGVWPMLKRVLRTGVLQIQSLDFLSLATSVLKPESIEVDLKVVMIGDHQTYRLLYELDPDFRKIFKVKADFDVEMPNDAGGRISYARFIRRIAKEENLCRFDRTAVAAVIERGARISGRTDRLSTRFNSIADLVRESCYWSRQDGGGTVTAEHVARAVRERIRRVCLLEDRVQDMLDRGLILVDTDGTKIGQVNGLSVYSIGDHAFGRPTRITASIGMGRKGILNIERESHLSGPTHDKGVLILTGFLRERFARDKPLTLSGSLCFEQSYSGVDGDSASSTEIYALLSSLSGLPLRQDLAVTGSVNQKGEIQPIGGVNLKIEGFFDTCASRGLTGRQGVMIPRRNLGELMLRHDVVEAVEAGKFHIYALDTIEQGIELLTGVKAGERAPDGGWPGGSVFALADDRLRQLAEGLKPFGAADGGLIE